MRHALKLLIVCSLLAVATPAFADFRVTDERAGFITMTTTTSTAVVVGTVMMTVVSARKDPTALQRYLRHNEQTVRAAMTLGAGEVVADLGAFFGVPAARLPEFARLLRRHRAVLTEASFDRRDVEKFTRLVETSMRFEPSLRAVLDA
jgi:predicted TIM-barrel fold metal-dependent hydrolase